MLTLFGGSFFHLIELLRELFTKGTFENFLPIKKVIIG